MVKLITNSDDQSAVAAAEHRLADAHFRLDLDIIDHLLHADYVIVQPGGVLETKADVLASYRTDDRHWDMGQVDQLDIRVHKNTAIVIGRWQASGRHGPEQFDYTARFLSIWIKQANRWQNIAYHATEIE